MARYIDADKLAEYITTNYCKNCDIYDGEKCNACGMNDALNFIETFKTADVVNKSEVARLEQDVTRLVQEKDTLIKNYAECMKDFARDIFEEIEKAIAKGFEYGTYFDVQRNITELKNKYTEGKGWNPK